ncbi:hypothetical protein PsorP6_010131 [Peronosclerospora sorghi]|uniref:Uncharacterized protein n=1 Tax=Peronosclerospora sorghi TaxID=230839 RepID=A0ACC0VWG8_9STRA|nr:hypothetical protein PsorP6_010131 [Peronosclerospora sorghi]
MEMNKLQVEESKLEARQAVRNRSCCGARNCHRSINVHLKWVKFFVMLLQLLLGNCAIFFLAFPTLLLFHLQLAGQNVI